jgi:hypothetical protein
MDFREQKIKNKHGGFHMRMDAPAALACSFQR